MALCQTSVLKVYHAVIEDVITNVRDAFLDEGVDEQVLQEMKQIWRNKLMASKAVEINPETSDSQPPPIVANNPKVSKPSKASIAKAKKAAAAAAAAAQQGANTTAAATPGLNTTTNTSADSKANLSKMATHIGGGGSTSTAAATKNGPTSKEVPTQPNPPPLHPTIGATLLQKQQQQSAASVVPQAATPPASSSLPIVATLDPNRIMPVNITLPAQPGVLNAESRVLTIQVPASALQENQLTQILTAHLISSIMSLPTSLASSVLQQHVNAALSNVNMQKSITAKQLDGALDSSEEDESEESDDNIDNDDDDDIDKDDDDDVENEDAAEEEPLNSEDDVTDEDAAEMFDTDNVIVCQYDKITRSRNKWKFYLKDGIMNMGGKDYVFQKSNGDAEW